MRIAIVHSFYSSTLPSGENAVVQEQVEALAEAGHEVLLVARHTDTESRQPLYAIRSAARVMTGRGPDPTEELQAFDPDVVHVHNLFPNFGTRWLRKWRGPLVATLHNYRPMCANGLLYREGHDCEECPTGSSLAAIRHACYHNSRAASVPLAVRNRRGPASDAVLFRADALICLSQRATETYQRLAGADLPIHLIPNGIDVPVAAPREESNGRWLVVSRLTHEKGVRELVEAWPHTIALDIVGSGPQAAEIGELAPASVRLLGSLARSELLKAMPNYIGLVFPSRWREMQPTVLLEAMACGLPIVAPANGAAPGLLGARVPVIEYGSRVGLVSALAQAEESRSETAAIIRAMYDDEFTRTRWVSRLETLYEGLAHA